MNTNLGYSKLTLADTSVLTAAGGHALISSLHVGEAEELSINSTAVSTLTSFSPSDALYGIYYNDGAELNSQQGFVLVFSMPGGGEYLILFNDSASRLIGTRYKATSNDNFNDWKYLLLGSTGPEDYYKVLQNVVNLSSNRGLNFPLLFASNTTLTLENYSTTSYGYYLNNINSYLTLDVTLFDLYLYYNQYYRTLYAPKIKGQELTLRGNINSAGGSINNLYAKYLDADYIYLMNGLGYISMDYTHSVSNEYILDLNFLSMYIDVSGYNSEHSGLAIDGDGVSIYGTGKDIGDTLSGHGTTNRSNFSSYTPLFSVKRYDTNNVVIAAYIDEPLMSLNGFHKIGSSDSYVLLGGGGHKALSDIANEVMGFKRLNITGSQTADANTMTVDRVEYTLLANYSNTNLWANMPNGMSWGNVLHIESATSLSGQLAWDSNHNVTTGVTRKLYWRSRNSTGWGTNDWHTIAFEDWVTTQLGGYLPLTAGSGSKLTGILYVNDIRATDDNGLLVYKPSGGWSGLSPTLWGVGASNCEGVIRSSAADLQHYRGSTSYPILDAYNYTNYLGSRPAVYATKSSTYTIEPNKEYYLPTIDLNTTINLQTISNFVETKVYEYKINFIVTSSSLPTITINGFTNASIQWDTSLVFARGKRYELSIMFVNYKNSNGTFTLSSGYLFGLWSVWSAS